MSFPLFCQSVEMKVWGCRCSDAAQRAAASAPGQDQSHVGGWGQFWRALTLPPALLLRRAGSSCSCPWHGASAAASMCMVLHMLSGTEMGSNVALGPWPQGLADVQELSRPCRLPARVRCGFPKHLAGACCSHPCLWMVTCCYDLPQPPSASCQHGLGKFGEPLTKHSINSSTRFQLWETPCDCLLETSLCSFFSLSGWHIKGNRNKENAKLANTSLHTNILIWMLKQQAKIHMLAGEAVLWHSSITLDWMQK